MNNRVLLLPDEEWALIKAEGPIDPAFYVLLLEFMEYREEQVMADVLRSFAAQS